MSDNRCINQCVTFLLKSVTFLQKVLLKVSMLIGGKVTHWYQVYQYSKSITEAGVIDFKYK